MCDLYEITLYSGGVYRYTDCDSDITLPDGRVFSAKGPILKRDRIKLTSGDIIDTLEVDVYVDRNDRLGGALFMDLAHNGGFDDARLSLTRCFVRPGGEIAGTVELFAGEIDTPEGGGLGLKFKVKSLTNRLNMDYPIRRYLPGCPYSVYDSLCGLDIAAFTVAGTVTEGSSVTMASGLVFPDGYYDQGGVDFTGGDLSGLSVPVKYSAGNVFTFLVPLPAAPKAGDTFNAYPGCDKRPETCRDKFNNWAHNRATPYIPMPEAII